jgi:hypothetical protein
MQTNFTKKPALIVNGLFCKGKKRDYKDLTPGYQDT